MEFVQIRKRHFFSIGEKTGYEESIWEWLSHPIQCLQPEGTIHALCTVPYLNQFISRIPAQLLHRCRDSAFLPDNRCGSDWTEALFLPDIQV